jgi:flagellar secretion chaperone FliS
MSNEHGSVNAYLRTKVLTASPEELRLILLDGAIKFAQQARDGLVNKDFEQSYNGFTQARAIVTELIVTIRPEFDPEFLGKVRALYAFMFNELVEASRDKDPKRVNGVIQLLQYERETWSLLISKLAEERGARVQNPATDPAATGPMASATSAVAKARAELSVEV